MIILDTNVISEEMKASPAAGVVAWFQEQPSDALYTTAVCEAEIRLGLAILAAGQRKQQLVQAADRILDLFHGRILAFDSPAAIEYAAIVAARRQVGRPINDFDAQIAAIARSRKMVLATRNILDFEGIDVPTINPWSA